MSFLENLTSCMTFNMDLDHLVPAKPNLYPLSETCALLIIKIPKQILLLCFAKAFDKVPYKYLLHKLKFNGISCNALNWITGFLEDRTQTVVL